jgi:hypothetical protein
MRSSFAIALTTIFISAVAGLTILSRQDNPAKNTPHCSSVQSGDPCTVDEFPCCVDDNHYAECDFIGGMTWSIGECDGGCVAISGTSVDCNLE